MDTLTIESQILNATTAAEKLRVALLMIGHAYGALADGEDWATIGAAAVALMDPRVELRCGADLETLLAGLGYVPEEV